MNEGKYINFQWVKRNPKTDVYEVYTKKEHDYLGQVKWYFPWRQYSFFPGTYLVFEKTCLRDIANFLEKLMMERNEKMILEGLRKK